MILFVLDVRTKNEFEEVHIKESHLIPIQELEQNIDKIPKDKKVVVHCASGKRSASRQSVLCCIKAVRLKGGGRLKRPSSLPIGGKAEKAAQVLRRAIKLCAGGKEQKDER